MKAQRSEQRAQQLEKTVLSYADRGKAEVGTWLVSVARSDFLAQFFAQDAPEVTDCELTVILNPGTGRLILRYDFGADRVIYAKLFPDNLGAHSHQVNTAFRLAGFDDRSRFRVPEPLAYLPEHRLLWQRGVNGIQLGAALAGRTDLDLIEGARAAAQWLVALHRSSLRIGAPTTFLDDFHVFRIFNKALKVAAIRPSRCDLLAELVSLWQSRLQRVPHAAPVVQTHGRFRHEHVFISRDAVSVIDLDRSHPAHPATDAAEFVHALRWETFKSGGDLNRADQAVQAFLDEYLAGVPEAEPGLTACWSSLILVTLLRYLKRPHITTDERQRIIEFQTSEMKRIGNDHRQG
ncbi:MAG TPA: hypothetical protein VNQ79_12250 [Blastocatellia bacterium]|nr:hypothetical protein [Blastocatellia bacterium]